MHVKVREVAHIDIVRFFLGSFFTSYKVIFFCGKRKALPEDYLSTIHYINDICLKLNDIKGEDLELSGRMIIRPYVFVR